MTEDEMKAKIVEIAKLASEIGWSIALPQFTSDPNRVEGLFLGEKQFLNLVYEMITNYQILMIEQLNKLPEPKTDEEKQKLYESRFKEPKKDDDDPTYH